MNKKQPKKNSETNGWFIAALIVAIGGGLYLLNKDKKDSKKTVEISKDKLELEFEKSLELRNFEIDKFWLRGAFFGVLLVAIVGGYFELYKEEEYRKYCLYFSFLAFLISLAQSAMNRGSKYWQERYEYHTKLKESAYGIDVTKTQNIFLKDGIYYKEKEFVEAAILSKNENFLARSKRFSVSKLAFLVWDIITLFFLGIWIKDSNILHHWYGHPATEYKARPFAIIFHIGLFLYIVIFFFWRKNWFRNKKWPLKILDGGGGQVYEKLGKNLIPSESPSKPNEVSRDDIEAILKSGKPV